MKRYKKANKNWNTTNIFKNKDTSTYKLTYHFHERWNERMNISFENKEDLEVYIKQNYPSSDIKHIDGDYYMMDNLIITSSLDINTGNIVFITICGSKEDNIIMYNILMSDGARGIKKVHNKYGKIHLQTF